MDDTNVIQFLDRCSKNLQRGAVPIALEEIEKLIHELTGRVAKPKLFDLLHIPQLLPGQETSDEHNNNIEIRQKVNQLARFLNERYHL